MTARFADRLAAGRDSLRQLSLRQVARRLTFRRIESLLYARALGQPVTLSLPVAAELRVATAERRLGRDEVDARLSPRRRGYVVMHGEDLVHASWVIDGPPTALAVGLAAGTPVIGESTTAPPFRGQGIYPFVLQAVVADPEVTSADGNAYVFVEPTNAASISGIERAGFRLVARATFVRVLGLVVWKRVQPA